jgi:hypothetical protein
MYGSVWPDGRTRPGNCGWLFVDRGLIVSLKYCEYENCLLRYCFWGNGHPLWVAFFRIICWKD